MLHLATLRSWVRRLGLQRSAHQFVSLVEQWQLRRFGSCEAHQEGADTVVFNGFNRTLRLSQLHPSLFELALSAQELPTVAAVLAKALPGSAVWDVGANVGFYSRLLAEAVGHTGKVISFEPIPVTFAELQEGLAERANVTPLRLALSDTDGEAQMAAPADHSSASRILMAGDEPRLAATIVTARGDSLVQKGAAPQPNFLKVDVEGHELAALQGMQELLSAPACAGVLVEVHFGLLEKAGKPQAPTAIRALLRNCGLSRQTWIARSHLLAERP